MGYDPLDQDDRAPASEQLGSARAPPPFAAPGAGHLLNRLRVMRSLLLDPPPLVGYRLALLPHVHVVTPGLHRSRRPAKLIVLSPSETQLPLV